ncbi:MAG: extracellular solute-binding protein, partial [Pseudomonadales bacterium]
NLDDVVAENPSAAATFDEIEPNLMAGMRSRRSNELNYFPTEWNNIVVYYNMDMFDEAGLEYPADDWTWEDFRKTAKSLTVKDDSGNTTRFGFALPGGNFGLQPWLLTNNTGYLDSTWTAVTVTTPEFRESLQFMHDLIHVDGSTAGFEMTGYQDDKLAAGLIAMSTAGHWPVPGLRKAGNERIGVANFPRNKSTSTVFGIGGVGVTKVSENRDLAWEFVQELTGEEYQQELADSNVSIPSWRRFATTEEWIAWPNNAEIFYASAASAIPVPSPGNFAEMEKIFMRNLESYLTNNQDLDTTIETMNSEMNRSMKRATR